VGLKDMTMENTTLLEKRRTLGIDYGDEGRIDDFAYLGPHEESMTADDAELVDLIDELARSL
jgi:hypothetical protein